MKNALICLIVLVSAVAARAADADKPRFDITWNVRIPMRDGVTLAARVYRPAPQPDKLPAVFCMSPYVADNYHGFGKWFATRGYVFVIADVRGRGDSGGSFEPFVHDPADAFDAIAWIAGQDFCDGQVTMWGSSYRGFNQWAALRNHPPALKTIIPIAAAHPGIDFPMWKNIFYPYNLQWLSMTHGAPLNNSISGDEAGYWIDKFTKLYEAQLPLSQLDDLTGQTQTVYDKWLAHPTPGPYWNDTVPTTEDYAQLNLPILTITGAYDADQWGALEYYRRHMRYGSQAARDRHYLVIGPWDHGGCVHPKTNFKGLTFDERSVIDIMGLNKAWYDWTLKDGDQPEFLEDRVMYYVAGPGAAQWQSAPTLDAVTTDVHTLHLASPAQNPDRAFLGGQLVMGPPPTDDGPDEYHYNPRDTSPAQWEQEDRGLGVTDQTAVLTLDGNGLVYHTPPCLADVVVAGTFKAVLWIELNVPDTDLSATVYAIEPTGRSIRLAEDLLRARYRKSLTEPQLVPTGEVLEYTFDTFNFVARNLRKGTRLRFVITCPNSIFLEKNFNTGGVVSQETGGNARVARVRVYHSPKYPSRIEVPVGQLRPGKSIDGDDESL